MGRSGGGGAAVALTLALLTRAAQAQGAIQGGEKPAPLPISTSPVPPPPPVPSGGATPAPVQNPTLPVLPLFDPSGGDTPAPPAPLPISKSPAPPSPVKGWAVKCSKSCAGEDQCPKACTGQQTQVTPCPSDSRKACPNSKVEGSCPDGSPPQDCEFFDWTDWTPFKPGNACIGLCERSRKIKTPTRCGGKGCKGLTSETKTCKCGQDCVMSTWTEWSGDCATLSQRERRRTILQPPSYGGDACVGNLVDTEACGKALAGDSEDCKHSDWMDWTACTATCGPGEQSRVRAFRTDQKNGGRPCRGRLGEMRGCNLNPCPVVPEHNCELTLWSDWTHCVPGANHMTRKRTVAKPATSGGQVCKDPVEEVQPCPSHFWSSPNCKLSDWSEWNYCDKTCDGGQTYRTRTVQSPGLPGGKACSDGLHETKGCNQKACNLIAGRKCRVSDWTEWGACSSHCGSGQQKRSRRVESPATHGGKGCTKALLKFRKCPDNPPCQNTDCEWEMWSDWTPCSATCETGTKTRARDIAQRPTHGGRPCKPKSASMVASCNMRPCKPLPKCIDAQWNAWTDWSQCTRTCEGGWSIRHREVTPGTACGKRAEGQNVDIKQCNAEIPCTCMLTDWSVWTTCTDLCVGSKSRTRKVAPIRSQGVTDCRKEHILQEMSVCGKPEAPGCPDDKGTDCKLGDWEAWSPCPVTCGGGEHVRRRDYEPATGAGKACNGSLVEVKPCGEDSCGAAVDCAWGDWGEWGKCTECGQEVFRHRDVKLPPSHGGRDCVSKDAREVKECQTNCLKKELYCVWETWSPYSVCSKTCGNGTRSRRRSLTYTSEKPADYVDEAPLAKECHGSITDVAECTNEPCVGCQPDNCLLSQWSDWSAPNCSKVCERTREVEKPNNECGKPCKGRLSMTKECTGNCESTNCVLSDWTAWSKCAGEIGQKFQSRAIKVKPRFFGAGCFGEMNVTMSCAVGDKAPITCELSPWTAWSPCDVACGEGQQSRTRNITKEAKNLGRACENALSMTRTCTKPKCPPGQETDNCAFLGWSEWSPCTGAEKQSTRLRDMRAPKASGKACLGPVWETRPCKEKVNNCEWSGWTSWTTCTATCGGGDQRRSRVVENSAQKGGSGCEGAILESKECNTEPCLDDKDCELSQWTFWSQCSVPCGGYSTRFRKVSRPALHGGKPCTEVTKEVRPCPPELCPDITDCKWAKWSPWSACIKAEGDCGVGYKQRTRDIAVHPKHGGALCAPRVKEQVMPVPNCEGQPKCCIDGKWTDWKEWSACSATCGTGVRHRARALAIKASWCGAPAEGYGVEIGPCSPGPKCISTPQDCVFSDWSAPGPCSHTCHGLLERNRSISVMATPGGKPCNGSTTLVEECNPAKGQPPPAECDTKHPADCVMSDWGQWSKCPAKCQIGAQTRTRNVSQMARAGGRACEPALEQVRSCFENISCTADCQWQDWTEWSACVQKQMTRTRAVKKAAGPGGKPCAGAPTEVTGCGDCLEDFYMCGWTDWSPWSACSGCGHDSTRNRSRHLAVGTQPVPEPVAEPPAAVGQAQAAFALPALRAQSGLEGPGRSESLVAAFGLGGACLAGLLLIGRALSTGREAIRPVYSAVSQEGQ